MYFLDSSWQLLSSHAYVSKLNHRYLFQVLQQLTHELKPVTPGQLEIP